MLATGGWFAVSPLAVCPLAVRPLAVRPLVVWLLGVSPPLGISLPGVSPPGLSPLAVRGQLAELVQDQLVPVQLGPDPQPCMLDDEVIGHGLARPQPVALVIELSRPRGQRPHPVLEVSAQDGGVEVAAHGQGEVDGIRLQPDLLQRFGAQGPQFAMPLLSDAVDGARGKLAVLLGAQRLDQALARQAVQGTV